MSWDLVFLTCLVSLFVFGCFRFFLVGLGSRGSTGFVGCMGLDLFNIGSPPSSSSSSSPSTSMRSSSSSAFSAGVSSSSLGDPSSSVSDTTKVERRRLGPLSGLVRPPTRVESVSDRSEEDCILYLRQQEGSGPQ